MESNYDAPTNLNSVFAISLFFDPCSTTTRSTARLGKSSKPTRISENKQIIAGCMAKPTFNAHHVMCIDDVFHIGIEKFK